MKSTSPPENSGFLPRKHLNHLLSEAVTNNLVTITAGAGYGKTHSVAAYFMNYRCTGAWLQFSKLDNHKKRFWQEFLYALSAYKPSAFTNLEQFDFPESLMEFDQFLHLFAKCISSEERFFLVFDDFHLIYDSSVIHFIENLIAANMEHLCIILLSRNQINLSTWSTNHLTEADLCFTLSETKEYLMEQDISLAESDIKKIQTYTEGWPLAINLIGLHLKVDEHAFIDPLSGTMPIIFRLIENEIFLHYSPKQRDFLIKLSYLEEFPSGLVYALSNEPPEAISAMLNNNMFIHMNPYIRKYHFHHIFLDFLSKKQFSLNSHTQQEVYLQAANWYEQNELQFDALAYYYKCGDYAKIWEIILRSPPERLPEDMAAQLIHFLSGLPESFKKQNPMVRVVLASYLLNNLDLRNAQLNLHDLITELKAMPVNEKNTAILGEAYIILALVRFTQKEYDFVDYCKLAAACLPKGSSRDYGYLKIIDSNNAFNPKSLGKADIDRFQKNLFEGMPYLSEVMHGFGYGLEYLAAAEASYFEGDYKKAQEHAFESIYRAMQKKQHDIVCSAYFLLMKVTAAKGDYNATMDYMKRSREYAEKFANYLSILDVAEGWFFIRIRREEKVARWLLNDSLNARIHPPVSVGRDRLIKAYYFLEKEQYDELLAFTSSLERRYSEKGLWLDLVSIQIFKAIALFYIGDISKCITTLDTLYTFVEENHFIMQFVEMGRHMRHIIVTLKNTNQHRIPDSWLDSIFSKSSTYAKRQAFYKTTYNAKYGFDNAARFQLTNREEELLKTLCQGLTREEIAECLNISVNTVKSTLQNIYSKLGAVNSVDAVRIAMQMKLI